MNNESKISSGIYSLIETTLFCATLKRDETRRWGLRPIPTAKGDKQQKSHKIVLSPASGKKYGCNNHPFPQKPNLLWPLRYMRFSGMWTLQHLITVKHRDRQQWSSCLYKLSLQQEWFWCRISLTMTHETSIQKGPTWGERGEVMEEQHFAVERRALCSATSGWNTNIWQATLVLANCSVRVRSCEAG